MIVIAALAALLGPDAAACAASNGAAILANVAGLKDAKGSVRLEIYPATEADFLARDGLLVAQGKTFRRISAPAPAAREAAMCIRLPGPGRYALLFIHDRDGKTKFNVWSDGAGLPSNARIGRGKPRLAQAIVEAGSGVTTVVIRAQYLRGFGGFGPIG